MTTTVKKKNEFSSAVQRLKEVNVNFLAVDFDQTLVDIHTGGSWQGTAAELADHVREEFIDLFHEAIDKGVRIAIVTFSKQRNLIREVLQSFLEDSIAAKIPIRGDDGSWEYKGAGSREGKQAHMASAVEELEHEGNIEIAKSNTLLVDDDVRNIKIAMDDGVRAVLFNPRKPQNLVRDLEQLL